MDDFHMKSNAIRMARGLEPIDGTRIEGFGPGTPPAPPPPTTAIDIPSAREQYGEPVEALADPAEPVSPPVTSPLIDMGRRNAPQAAKDAPSAPNLPEVELCVMDSMASYQNRVVALTEPERVAIARLVVRALKRDLDTLEVGTTRVRRLRTSSRRSETARSTASSTGDGSGSASPPSTRRSPFPRPTAETVGASPATPSTAPTTRRKRRGSLLAPPTAS